VPDRRATVCLPTYNERENLEPMLRALGDAGVRVLVVDDNSPDGTGRLADRLAQELDYVDVLHRSRKEGLGPAYIAGFRQALADGAELILEMDCDFSHDPKDVPRLIAATDDADLALGSRYVKGGQVADWGPTRRAISAGGSFYARVLLSSQIRDLTGGFKCYRRQVLETIDLDAIDSKGYAFQIETTYRSAAGRLPRRRGSDPVRRPRGRQLQDERRDRAGGDLEGARAPYCRAHRQAVAVREVTDESFQRDVLEASEPVVVDFWAPWCGPCHAVEPVLAELEREHEGKVGFAKLNIDENIETASRFSVLSIPTTILFEDGRPQETVIGARPRAHYEKAWAPWLQVVDSLTCRGAGSRPRLGAATAPEPSSTPTARTRGSIQV
jgi:dolichol-phosphate mannosyltransferase